MVNSYYPETVTKALEIRREHPGAQLIMGGSDVMVVRKFKEDLIFLNQISELKKVCVKGQDLYIGAGAVYSELLQNDLIPELLKRAVLQIASPAIRNVGTVAGNICNASPAGDTLPVLYVMDALVEAESVTSDGEISGRMIPIEDFIRGVRKTDLKDNEIVTAVIIPDFRRFDEYEIRYEKVGGRRAEAISKLSFAGMKVTNGDKVRDIRFSFGSVGVTTLRMRSMEKKIADQGWGAADEVISDYEDMLKPIDDQRSTAKYRKTVCLNLLRDFLKNEKTDP